MIIVYAHERLGRIEELMPIGNLFGGGDPGMAADRDRQRFELALASPDASVALHELAKALKSEGMTQVAMYHLFAEFQRKIDSDDPCYDAILDNMDLIWGGGWAKGRALFEKELTSANIAEPGDEADSGQ